MIHVGVLSPVTGGFFFGEVLAGIVREVAASGGRVTLVQTLDAGLSGDEISPAPDLNVPVGWDHIDGFIAIALAASEASLRAIQAAGKPVVLTSTLFEDFDAVSVMADNYAGVHAAVSHLVEHGHVRIAFVGNLEQTDMIERHQGYLVAMAEHGLPTEGLFFPTADHVESGGQQVVEAILTSRPPITAVVTTTDRVAIGLMQVLGERGVRVPQDVAIIGFDNIEAGWHTSPPLATVDQNVIGIGARAAQLLLAELRGASVERGRHTAHSTLLPRGTCGCASGGTLPSRQGIADGRTLVRAIGEHLGLPLLDDGGLDRGADPGEIDLVALGDVIEATVSSLFPAAPSPETLTQFTETVMELLGHASIVLGTRDLPGGDVLQHCMAQVTTILSHLQALSGLDRAEHLSVSLAEQYDVGMELLGRVGADPSDLRWLAHVGVRLGCLGLWDGPPEQGMLLLSAVYDPARVLDGDMSPSGNVRAFPPLAIVEETDPTKNEVTFVIPVKGASGDHGLLCIVGPVDTHSGTGRATYNHWAALLGVALKQQRLLEKVRLSEERYAVAARAANDGLWERDVASGDTYMSERGRTLLDLGPDDEADEPSLMAGVHPDDRGALQDALDAAEAIADVPVEVEYRRIRPDGSQHWLLTRALGVAPDGGAVRRLVGSVSDIDHRKTLEEQLRHAALFDTVTGLPNRRLFLDRLGWAVEQAQRSDGSRFAVVFLDLDGFKLINDSLGHLMGDELLKAVGERLQHDLRSVDTAARIGGDEFAVLLYGLKQEAVLVIVERLQERIAEPVMLGDHEVSVTASIGIATSDTGYTNAEDVLRDADIAMYHAKEVERGTACLFDPVMHTRATSRLRAQSELRAALVGEQFVVHYQPIVELNGSVLRQFEALVRWEHPERGLLLPADFLPIMAETGTIVVLGQWIIDTVCRQIAGWRRDFHGPFAVSVNLSHREFWSDQLLLTVTQALSRHHVPPRCLILEITESVIMSDTEAARQIMADLHATGIRMHIDDFGTGQSSLHALRAFPVDALKIDQSFVHQLDVDTQTTELVRIIVGMGRTLGLDVVAEGVETDAQADQLRTMGCGTAQGWLYAEALPGDEAGKLLGTTVPAHADETQRA